VLAIEGKLLPQKQVFGHESSSRLKSRPQELAEVRSETEEDRNERSYSLHSSGILPNGHRDWNGKDTGRTPGTNRKKTVGFLHFASPLLVLAHHSGGCAIIVPERTRNQPKKPIHRSNLD
jgi:hypothetical protein